MISVIIRTAAVFTLRRRFDERLIIWIMIAGVILVLIASAYRLLPAMLGYTTQQPDWLINFSPLAALCLCGAAMLPKRLAIALPFTILLGTDLVMNAHYGHELFNAQFIAKTVVMALVAAFGWQLRSNPRLRVLLPTTIAASLFFYLTTNTVAWMTDPGYALDFAGWTQAVTTGLPIFPQPTWMFFRNSVLSDVVFTLLFVVCVRPMPHLAREEKTPAAAW